MQQYIARRGLQSLLALWVMSLVVFSLARISGNPLDVLLPLEAGPEEYAVVARHWGLDQPLYVQYGIFLGNALRGDFGNSWLWQGHTVMSLVMQRLPATLELAGIALAISLALALPIGVVAAVMKDTPVDSMAKTIALLGQSLPAFWLGIVLMWIFAVKLGWLPPSGNDGLQSIILPAITLGWFQVAAVMRLVRSSMLEVLDSEFVKLARIKGLPEWKVIWKHCLRNAAIAPLTFFGITAGVLMTGSVVTETVFSWPGIGLLIVDAVRARDFHVVQAVIIIFAGIFIAINLVVDVLYAYLDPRIQYR
ncbi:ABC transporter permease [Candidatus Entotheonella palauensis]|uniref:Glutathione ABC transporter permease n=1 Tax=Candidatus Entotheonella gemina TaxID=1429439 RepID=W4MFG9_9BACT|nr:ABC transporter permease [Candidatus Entotheonella palauensis]ETX08387.1 MAG: glutathione ABC transporter permease [Candidatus Entotheonella gemina]